MEKYERLENNVETKRKVEEAKRMSNFKWRQDFDTSYQGNKKKFWKEVRRVRKGGSRTEIVKDVNGRLLRGSYLSIYIPWPFPPVWGVADNTKETNKNNGGFTPFFQQ